MNLGRQGFSGEMSLAWLELGASDQGKWEFWGPGEVRPSRGGWGLPGVGTPRPSQVVLVVKNLPANARDSKRHWFDPWVRKSLGKGHDTLPTGHRRREGAFGW